MAAEVPTEQVFIDLGERSYRIEIGVGLIGRIDPFASCARPEAAAVIVTNSVVGPLYADALSRTLAQGFAQVEVVEVPDGEQYKDWATLNRIFDALLELGLDRGTTLFALGGGVVGDIAGFAAACYLRGIAYVQVPTTLLAQVDSSVGGKTAVNHALGKNMIGVFNQPRHVVADLDTLRTLPMRELIAGLAEVIKYGPIADPGFTDWTETHIASLKARDASALMYAVRRCCEIKAKVVSADEREDGLRETLNFGHTFAHAIETGLGHGAWLHGEAVGCGMVMSLRLSERLGLVAPEYVRRMTKLIERAGLPVVGPRLGVERYLQLMRRDKKSRAGAIRFVLIDSPGHACVRTVADEDVAAVIEAATQ